MTNQKASTRCYGIHEYTRRQHVRALTNSTEPSYKVLFFGTDRFALRVLQELNTKCGLPGTGIGDLEVVCPPQRGRRKGASTVSPVRSYSESEELTLHTFPNNGDWSPLPEIASGFDIAVVVSFGHLIPSDVVSAFRVGSMNLHPSDLPRHRGAAPIQHTILSGDQKTAASVIELSTGLFDHGRILNQKRISVSPGATFETLSDQLADIGAGIVAQTIADYQSFKSQALDQNNVEIVPTRAPKINKEMGLIDWDAWTADRFDATFRAIGHQVPLMTSIFGKHVRILSILPQTSLHIGPPDSGIVSNDCQPGTALFDRKTDAVIIKCCDNNWVGVTSFQFPTKRPITAASFANGYGLRKESRVLENITQSDI